MATHYRNLTTRPDMEFLGGTQTRAVIVLAAYTVPSGIYFEARYPAKGFTVQDGIDTANGFGIFLEGMLDIPGVETLAWSQAETIDNQLEDVITFYVTSTSGDSSDTLTVPYAKLAPGVDQKGFVNPEKAVPALRAKLDALESS